MSSSTDILGLDSQAGADGYMEGDEDGLDVALLRSMREREIPRK